MGFTAWTTAASQYGPGWNDIREYVSAGLRRGILYGEKRALPKERLSLSIDMGSDLHRIKMDTSGDGCRQFFYIEGVV